MNTPAVHRARILLVEDNLFSQQVGCELLEDAGAIVRVANNGREALDLLARQTLQRRLIEAGQLRRTDTQHQRSVQLNPQATTIALYALNPPTQHGETRVTQLLRSQDWRLFPQALTGFARLLLGNALASDLGGIGRDGHQIAQAFGQQLSFQILPAGVVGVGQGATVMVLGLSAELQTHAPVIGRHQCL